jgi:hypothetical protein
MKYLTTKIFFILLFVSVAFTYGQTNYFSAKSDGANVKVEWTSGDESDVNHYSILRKTPQTPYIEIATIQPKGDNSYYSYEDQSLYKTKDIIFIYQLKTVFNSKSPIFSKEVSVSPNISGIKRTWGSIKAMFR